MPRMETVHRGQQSQQRPQRAVAAWELEDRQREARRKSNWEQYRPGQPYPGDAAAQSLRLHAMGESPEAFRLSQPPERTHGPSGAVEAADALLTAAVRAEARATGRSFSSCYADAEAGPSPEFAAFRAAVLQERNGPGRNTPGVTLADQHEAGVERLAQELSLSADEAARRYGRGERAGATRQPGTFQLSQPSVRERFAEVVARESGVTVEAAREAVDYFAANGVVSFDGGVLRID